MVPQQCRRRGRLLMNSWLLRLSTSVHPRSGGFSPHEVPSQYRLSGGESSASAPSHSSPHPWVLVLFWAEAEAQDEELQRASLGANVCNSTEQQLFPGTGRTSHFYRQILESTAQLYNENTDIRGENQSLPHHLSHMPEISGQNPQGETTLRSLSSLATSGYQNKRCGEQHYYTIHNSPSFLYLERCSLYRSPDSRLQEWL